MNRDELTLCKELSESNEWQFIRERLLALCSGQSSSDQFCDKYMRGMLYAIKTVDEWADEYYAEVKKEQARKEIFNG